MHSKKSGLLLCLQVLEKETDENHHLTQKEIGMLMSKYSNNPDLKFDRKTIAEYLRILNEDFDLDIIYEYPTKGSKNSKRKGYALEVKDFTDAQVQVLMDSLISSKFISQHALNDYKDSIFKHLSKYSEQFSYNFISKTGNISKNANAEIFLNAEIIIDAIKEKREISFNYKRFDSEGNIYVPEKKYVFTPFYLVNNFGNYYMLCGTPDPSAKGNKILFKVNYMTNIKIGEKSSLQKKNLKGFGQDFDISKYLNENVYLYDTDKNPIDAEILILDSENEDLNNHLLSSRIAYVKEWFGDKAKIFRKNNKTYFSVRCSETGLKFWLLQFSSSFELIKPTSLRTKILNELNEVVGRYKKCKFEK